MPQSRAGAIGQLTAGASPIMSAAAAAAVAPAVEGPDVAVAIAPSFPSMNAKVLLKSLFVLLVLLLLVLMGMNNRGPVDFALPPIVPKRIQIPAALMYFGCCAVGFLTGTIVWAGGGKKGSSSRSSSERK